MDSDATAIIEFILPEGNVDDDLEVPLKITANDLILALNEIYHMDLETQNVSRYSLKMKYPLGIISGSKVLGKSGVRNGTVITVEE